MGYLEEPLKTYTDALASGEPTPGGGSVAALAGALGAALNSMVANFTVGRKQYADVEDDVRTALAGSEELRNTLERLTQADTEAYGQFAAAQKMPRETDAQKAARKAAMQGALRTAASVPREVVRSGLQVLNIAPELAKKGNPNLITDVGCAVKLAFAAMECAALNVEINLAFIKDEAYVDECRKEMGSLLSEGEKLAEQVWGGILEKVRGE